MLIYCILVVYRSFKWYFCVFKINKDTDMDKIVCKGITFRNSQVRKDVNGLSDKQQLIYYMRRKYAVPIYVVSSDNGFTNCCEVSKSCYDRQDVPVNYGLWKAQGVYRLYSPFFWIHTDYTAVTNWPFSKDHFAEAMDQFVLDAKQMATYVLLFAGYVNTANFHWRRKMTVENGDSDVIVSVELSDPQSQQSERFVFLFQSVKTSTGLASCHLHSLLYEKGDNESIYLLEPGFHGAVFDKLVFNAHCEDAVNLD